MRQEEIDAVKGRAAPEPTDHLKIIRRLVETNEHNGEHADICERCAAVAAGKSALLRAGDAPQGGQREPPEPIISEGVCPFHGFWRTPLAYCPKCPTAPQGGQP